MEEGIDKDPSSQSQAVKVAVHIRPLIAQERIQGCKECVLVVPGEPQVQLGAHSFTFDHVYGAGGSAPCAIFDECVKSLVDGLFHGYNATVLAYGQTGSGKTYTMGTAYTVGGSTQGVIPQVMDMIYSTVEDMKHKADIQIRVSFIEILKEEVHDLLDPNPPACTKPENATGGAAKNCPPGKPPVQIRETGSGGIILAGVTETEVASLSEMSACLEQGSLCRATGSTNMNSQSSRSHAIFTINVEQRRKWDAYLKGDVPIPEDSGEDFLCAKLHLVDLAGSERAKRTKADGNRFKEGVHINRGLLALGNVISALGDDKKRKEGGHVPYRDSKLTRLLQDSLGGNSRTVMIACVSPADSNAEETLNTLKYANRARNIQNKPIVNRDPLAAEMQKMRQQLEILQAELLCARATSVSEEIEILKQKVSWLEASNLDLRHELKQSSVGQATLSQQVIDVQVERDRLLCKLQKLRNGEHVEDDDIKSDDLLKSYHMKIQELEMELQRVKPTTEKHTMPGFGDAMDVVNGDNAVEGEDVAEKELEHSMLQDCLDKELQELNKHLELKEAEMKTFARPDNVVLKQHFEKKLLELEEEKKHLQKQRDELLKELETLATSSDEHAHKMQETYVHKLKDLEHQILELRKKQENQAQLLRQKQRSDEAAKRLQEDIQRIKQQKVQLQNKIKQESEQFRAWKNQREKEVLQLRKEGRRNEYEMHKLQALHQRQKLVLQRKTEEAAAATRRLKELLDARKVSPRENSHGTGPSVQSNERAMQQWLDQELEVAVRVHEVRTAYEKQTEERVAMAKELAKLNEEEHVFATPAAHMMSPVSMSPSARRARIGLIETMINASSSSLVAMASQLSEAEERERAFTGRARWQSLRTIGDIKNMLNLSFNAAAFARCQVRDKEIENKELQEKINELSQALKQSEARRLDVEEKQRLKENAVAVALATASKDGTGAAVQRGMEELSNGLLRLTGKKLQYSGDNANVPYDLRKVSRESTVYKDADSDSSEWDADMELEADISDEDWEEEDEKCVGKNRKTTTKKPSSMGSRKSSFSGIEEAEETVVSDSDLGDCEDKTKLDAEVCCSCSQSSGCKTKKCECRLAGGLCGMHCSCKASKCANREYGEVECDTASIAGSSRDNSEAATRADELLAKHGAKLLDRAFKEEVTSEETEGATVVKLRRPLSDIGNTKVTISVQKPVKQKRKSQAVEQQEAQAPPPPESQDQQESAALPSAEPPLSSASTEATVERRYVPARPPPVPHQQQQHQQQQQQVQVQVQGSASSASATPRTSPLRTRNRHRSGLRDEAMVKRAAARSKSPCKKPGEEKENLR